MKQSHDQSLLGHRGLRHHVAGWLRRQISFTSKASIVEPQGSLLSQEAIQQHKNESVGSGASWHASSQMKHRLHFQVRQIGCFYHPCTPTCTLFQSPYHLP